MNGSFLLDTNIIIDILTDKISKDQTKIDFENDNLFTSVITRVELLSYPLISQIEENKIFEILQLFTIIPFNKEIEIFTILIRRNTHLKIPDAIIVASALSVGATLLTKDHQLLKLKWPGLVIHSPLDFNNSIKINSKKSDNSKNNGNNIVTNDNNDNGNHNNNDNENKDNNN